MDLPPVNPIVEVWHKFTKWIREKQRRRKKLRRRRELRREREKKNGVRRKALFTELAFMRTRQLLQVTPAGAESDSRNATLAFIVNFPIFVLTANLCGNDIT